MKHSIKSKLPLTFLACMSTLWFFYYNTESPWNNYGKAKWEWLFLIDVFIVLPIICFICIKNKKQALLKLLVLTTLAIFIGSYIIPEQHKVLWPYFEQGRYFVASFIILFELIALLTVCLAISVALKQKLDPDRAIERAITRHVGKGAVATVLCFETRMWTFALFAKQVKATHFHGNVHFSYHEKDGAKSNLLGFIILIAFEIPIVHLLLHFIWSPMAANIVTLLTVFSLIFFIAEYRAIDRRPISLCDEVLHIRYGLYQPIHIPVNNIAKLRGSAEYIKREKHVKRLNYSGVPNVVIELKKPIGNTQKIYIGLDNPKHFIRSVESKLKQKKDNHSL
ncbi:hypothetical protein [Pseudoalteromonas luteoviolacea]|uniref:Beta-carotene 15,15'-monooxygenase n=1 Tax=Pseudoalteromonas luteoviolacea S4054 TaxID=1129367 RepID=A0A0F6AED6_9GAMM|nr:hypothetical protein [Pseudoalteromonas luteoviolacea]AOT11203.1 hypothetical protein S4054249_25600 [Pseudoalteromonas luteoviolacea]AOT15633.1 hypothetical protein S40542_22910 [Pseudoalteromonas luteoviolacea]AOT21024.1 hypothetical protein S4054_25520 [Pseudoalteromonas luteoviolacea]KKE84555.1 hypothetical protein N479_08295 [Pseudoalteromonas luteoviolacea S4054]KZN71300.1 hypothetical protein N481_19125 [Pseudoalteromonas luteoviolacea S4047-1]